MVAHTCYGFCSLQKDLYFIGIAQLTLLNQGCIWHQSRWATSMKYKFILFDIQPFASFLWVCWRVDVYVQSPLMDLHVNLTGVSNLKLNGHQL